MMNSIRYILFSIYLLSLLPKATAQNSGETSGGSLLTDKWKNTEQADKLFREKNYGEAVKMYEKIVQKKETLEIKLRIGKCYFLLKEPQKSVQWYGQVMDTVRLEDPRHCLYYAQALSQLRNYEVASVYFKKYAQIADSYTINYQSDSSYFYQKKDFYVLHPMASLNSEESDFAPTYYRNKVVFVSSRDDFTPIKHINRSTGNHIFKLYSSEIIEKINSEDKFETDKVQKLHKNIRSQFNQGPAVFYANDSKMIFTQNNAEGRKGKRGKTGLLHLGLYFAEQDTEGNWVNIKPFQHNSHEYSLAHPAISRDGKTLYFASDMPNGKGASDIYVSHLQADNTWTAPRNLGAPINTAGKEVFPFLFEKAGENPKLYFSSDGHGGLGGLEILYTRLLDDGWTPPDNMGFPICTNYDDFAFAVDSSGHEALFTSNRAGGQGDDDIYAVRLLKLPESGRFLKIAGRILEENLTGTTPPKPLKNVAVRIINKHTNEPQTDVTDSLGNFQFEVALETPYLVEATKDGYHPQEREIKPYKERAVNPDEPNRILTNEIHLVLKMSNKNAVLDTEFVDEIFTPEQNLIDSASSLYADNGAIGIMPDDMKFNFLGRVHVGQSDGALYGIPITVYDTEGQLIHQTITDTEGDFRLYLKDNHTYLIRTAWEKDEVLFSADCIKLQANKLPKNTISDPLHEFFIMPLTLNSMRSFRINYGVKEWDVNEQVAEQLDKIAVFMKANPTVKAELSAHTDSRGEAKYNQMLSLLRAQDAVKYLMMKGIDGNRLEAKGYGEQMLLNHCADNVRCSNQEHEINRRIEITIIGFDPSKTEKFDPKNCTYCPERTIE